VTIRSYPRPQGTGRFDRSDFEPIKQGSVILGLKSKSQAVLEVKRALIDLGFLPPSTVDKNGQTVSFLTDTFAAIDVNAMKNFQVHAQKTTPGIRVTGKVDGQTLAALEKLSPPVGMNIVTLASTSAASVLAPSADGVNIPEPQWGGKNLRVVLAKDEHRTFLFDTNGRLQGVFPNAHGRPNVPGHQYQTQTGLKKLTGVITGKPLENLGQRLWQNPKVFGPFYLDLSWEKDPENKQKARTSPQDMHGTPETLKLGTNPSHGCMRHENQAITFIRSQLSIGDYVAVASGIDDPRLSAGLTIVSQ
jgi:L,D-transpeptidase YnhG